MKQESITIREKETAAKIQNTHINAVRTKDITKKGVRVFADGNIGISGGAIGGDVAEEKLVENAIQNLSVGIEYPYPISRDRKDHRSYNDNPMTAGGELLSITESILETLRKEYPDFDFSETISANEIMTEMRNSEGLDLKYEDAHYSLG